MPKFVRVRDKDTGHQFDVADGDSRIGEAFEPVKGTEPVEGYLVRPRESKYHVDKAGKPAASSRTTAQEG